MIAGGNVTLIVKDMDRAVEFYTQVLRLRLQCRFENYWAVVDAGRGFQIGLHPEKPQYPPAGQKGGMMIGLNVSERMETILERLDKAGVALSGGILESEQGRYLELNDPDGHMIYLWAMSEAMEEAHGLKTEFA